MTLIDPLGALNPAQKMAASTLDGPVLVLAGAGAGKTRVLVARIAHLLAQRRAQPYEILAVTFTNKAAREMKQRIADLIGPSAEGLRHLGTFHAIAAQMLRRHAELVGLNPQFSIIDTDDQLRVLKQILEAESIDDKRWPPKQLHAIIDQFKNRGWRPDQVPAAEGAHFAGGRAIKLYALYQQRLASLNACDFGDLLLHGLTVLTQHADVLADYQRRFKYILVDEYQDTNVAQYLWLRLLAAGHKNICVVGDDDQSIYGWRGAEVDNILRFETDFPGAAVVKLEQNYRSTAHILGAAAGVIAQNSRRLGKTLWTDAEAGEPVRVRGVWDGEAEARLVSDDIESWQRRGRALSDVAVLVRAAFQMRAFEERFITSGIPYQVIGGPRFFERQEIRDAHAYFRLLIADDDLALERVINVPKRGIGDATVQKLSIVARESNISMLSAARALIGSDELPGRARNALSVFIRDLDRWRGDAQTLNHQNMAEMVLEEAGIIDMWKADKTPAGATRLENLKELVQSMGVFDSLPAYLEHVSLVMDLEREANGDAVRIMTLHGAKGLEFPLVFLPGWEEGVFPSQRALDEGGAQSLEEERRLAYVGLTRAREDARISHAANRMVYGRWQNALPSRFIEEIPSEHKDEVSEVTARGGGGYTAHLQDLYSASGSSGGYDSPGYQRFKNHQPVEPPVKKLSAPGSFQRGDKVHHAKFGPGEVRAAEGDKLQVWFKAAGEKRVMASFVERV